jgi:hypothetical protein
MAQSGLPLSHAANLSLDHHRPSDDSNSSPPQSSHHRPRRPTNHSAPSISSASSRYNQLGHSRWPLANIFGTTPSRPSTPHRPPTSRIWNPQNFSPREPLPSSAVLPSARVVAAHPAAIPAVPVSPRPRTGVASRDEFPLLTLPEQRRSRQSLQSLRSPTSLAVELESSGDRSERTSIRLPPDVVRAAPATDDAHHDEEQPHVTHRRNRSVVRHGNVAVMVHQGSARTDAPPSPFPVSATDEESADPRLRKSPSKITLPTGLQGDRPDTRHGDDGSVADDESTLEWGPSHPCFPHMNPHVPLSSPLYGSTRIIRIQRDWMMAGDMAPTFANVYPEILDNVLPEDEFRRLVRHVNEVVMDAHNPFGWRAWVDTLLGIATFWLWDDLGFTGIKSKLRQLETWLTGWNREVGSKEGVQIIPLRRTAYLTVSPPSVCRFPADFVARHPNTRSSGVFGPHLSTRNETNPNGTG